MTHEGWHGGGAVPDDLVEAGRDLGRRAGTGMLLVGAALTALGGWGIATAFGIVPTGLRTAVQDWWPVPVLAGGVVLLARGERPAGLLVGGAALVALVTRHVPTELVWPSLLIVAGVAVLASATGARRWALRTSGLALFGDRRVTIDRGEGTRSLLAVFGDTTGTLDGDAGEHPVTCLAVFGSVELTVPADVHVRLRETAVFGDVRAPGPARASARSSVSVTATAVFGDVRVRRV